MWPDCRINQNDEWQAPLADFNRVFLKVVSSAARIVTVGRFHVAQGDDDLWTIDWSSWRRGSSVSRPKGVSRSGEKKQRRPARSPRRLSHPDSMQGDRPDPMWRTLDGVPFRLDDE